MMGKKLHKNKKVLCAAVRHLMSISRNKIVSYNEAVESVLHQCLDKKIKFDEYYRKQWGISMDGFSNFEVGYFKDSKERDLYIFLAALADGEIFNHLKEIWKREKNEELCGTVLFKEIYSLKDQGVTI